MATHADETLRVMIFNIRFGAARDGDKHWDDGMDSVARTVADFDPDIAGTHSKFNPKHHRQRRIDWILHSPHFAVHSARINRNTQDGRLPSDRFPVDAVYMWPANQP